MEQEHRCPCGHILVMCHRENAKKWCPAIPATVMPDSRGIGAAEYERIQAAAAGVIPATDLRAWIADHRPLRFKSDLANGGYLKALTDLSAWLDEYTTEALSGGEQ